MMIDNMILREIDNINKQVIERIEQLKNQWASKEEINVVISEALFKVEVLLNWIPYHLMR